MTSRKYDSFKDLKKGKYDWNVQARVLNMWRGYTKMKEPFKSFNILLLDSKRSRIHAFVPGNEADNLENKFVVGKIYLIENFTVKNYRAEDIFRPIRKDIQIALDGQTKVTPLEEKDASIEKYVFDMFDLSELEALTNQKTYLTDVIGFMENPKPLAKIKNVHGQIQSQVKFRITDGSNSVKVTFWDDFAEMFCGHLKQALEHPIIIIIGSCRVTKWSNEVNIANTGATTYHLNCEHRTVTEMRKMLSNPSFPRENLTTPTNPPPKLFTVKEIKNFGEEHCEREVLCQVKVRKVQNIQSWFVHVCTSCYQRTEMSLNTYKCQHCPRKGSYPDKKFEVYIFASDSTGALDIMLQEREVRRLIGKTVFNIMDEGHTDQTIPAILKTIENKEVTVKLLITKEHINGQDTIYTARDIMEGFNIDAVSDDETQPHPIDHMQPQTSASSYHLDSLSAVSNTNYPN